MFVSHVRSGASDLAFKGSVVANHPTTQTGERAVRGDSASPRSEIRGGSTSTIRTAALPLNSSIPR